MPSTLLSTLPVSSKIIDRHYWPLSIVEAGGDRDIDVGSLTPSLTGMRSLQILRRGYQRPPHVSTSLASGSEARQVDTRVSLKRIA